MIEELSSQLNANVSIEDQSGKIIFSHGERSDEFESRVEFENEHLGFVKGDQHAGFIAQFLNHFLEKEKERKKLGSEVLNLYQEINLIFNFSDKLAQTIGAKAISEITLKEASGVIQSEYGVIVLWDQEHRQLK